MAKKESIHWTSLRNLITVFTLAETVLDVRTQANWNF